jgi:hypothetical protein
MSSAKLLLALQSRRSLGGGGEKIKRALLCRDSPSFFVTGSYHRLLFAADRCSQRDRGVPSCEASAPLLF